MEPEEAFDLTQEELMGYLDIAQMLVKKSRSPKEMIQMVETGPGGMRNKLILLFIATSLLAAEGRIQVVELPPQDGLN